MDDDRDSSTTTTIITTKEATTSPTLPWLHAEFETTTTTTTALDELLGPPLPPAAAEQQHQPRSLTECCLHTLARNLDVLADRKHRNRVFPVDLFLRLLDLCKSHEWVHAADVMLRITQNLPCVDTPEVDEVYWKAVCELSLSLNIPITVPYPALVARVREMTACLEAWMVAAAAAAKQKERKKAANAAQKKEKEALNPDDFGVANICESETMLTSKPRPLPASSSSSSSSSSQGTTTVDATPAAALRLLREVAGLPMSVRLLQDSAGLGETLSRLSKSDQGMGVSEEVIKAASKLRRTWKSLVKQQVKHEEKVEKYDDYNGEEEEPMSPFNIGLRALTVQSWKDVFVFSIEHGEYRRGKIGKRALLLAEAHEAKKRRTVVVQEKLGDAADIEAEMRKGKPPPGNTKMVAKLVGYRPPVKAKTKPFGGLQFASPKKKKHLMTIIKPLGKG